MLRKEGSRPRIGQRRCSTLQPGNRLLPLAKGTIARGIGPSELGQEPTAVYAAPPGLLAQNLGLAFCLCLLQRQLPSYFSQPVAQIQIAVKASFTRLDCSGLRQRSQLGLDPAKAIVGQIRDCGLQKIIPILYDCLLNQ